MEFNVSYRPELNIEFAETQNTIFLLAKTGSKTV